MKKLLVMFSIVLSMLTTCLVGCEITDTDTLGADKTDVTAAAVFTLDVNPGVRVYVKSDDTVIKVEATNEDGEAVISEIAFEGVNYETVIEEIVDKMNEKGFLEGEESSVLISVEKKEIEISEKLNEKIEKAFEKHGKKASVIEQELIELEKDIEKTIGDMAERYNISEGKAHLIEKIREEFPELSEEELAGLKVNDLGMMLEETSDDVKGHFKKVGPPVEDAYIGREKALTIALESLEITVENITMKRVIATRCDGKMVYEVEFVYDGMEYEIIVDAESGTILETESEEFEEFDVDEFIESFEGKNEIDLDKIKNEMISEAFGKEEPDGEHNGKNEGDGRDQNNDMESEPKPLSRGEVLKKVMSELGILEEDLKKTDVKLHKNEDGAVFSVIIETEGRNLYRVVVEAYTGTVLEAEFNGIVLEGAKESE